MSENKRIAKAAGLIVRSSKFTTGVRKRDWNDLPDWRSDPGACATWLLPVLEKKLEVMSFDFCCHDAEMRWSVTCVDKLIGFAPMWHEAIIAAILATGEGE